MKKYRLKNPDMKGVVTGHIGNGKIVILGDEDSTDVELNNRYIFELLSNEHNTLAWVYGHTMSDPPRFYENETILERVGDGWPIELGLVEEIPEEPKRVYMDMYEALRMVYEHGKKVAYDSEEWEKRIKHITLIAGTLKGFDTMYGCEISVYTLIWSLGYGHNKKLWYVVEED